MRALLTQRVLSISRGRSIKVYDLFCSNMANSGRKIGRARIRNVCLSHIVESHFFLVSGGKTSSGAPVSFLFLSKQLIDHSSLSTDSVVQVQNRIYALSKPGVSFCVRLFSVPCLSPSPYALSLFSTSRCTHTLFRSIYALTCASETIGREFYQESHHRVTVGTNNYSVGGKV